MKRTFKAGDHVEWTSEAGRVRGTILKKITSEIRFKGYTVRASKAEPQYLIQSERTDHLAMHKGSALRKLREVGKQGKLAERRKAEGLREFRELRKVRKLGNAVNPGKGR